MCPLSEQHILQEFADVFADEVGCLKGKLCPEIIDNVRPVQLPVRRVPIAVQERLKEELQSLERRSIVQKVDAPTEWVSTVVVE